MFPGKNVHPHKYHLSDNRAAFYGLHVAFVLQWIYTRCMSFRISINCEKCEVCFNADSLQYNGNLTVTLLLLWFVVAWILDFLNARKRTAYKENECNFESFTTDKCVSTRVWRMAGLGCILPLQHPHIMMCNCRFYLSPNVIRRIKSSAVIWVRHVARMEQIKKNHKIFYS